MSILIKGMEMPKEDEEIIIRIDSDGTVMTEYALPISGTKAVSVPPHGRLIDADAIMKFIQDGLNNGEFGYDQIKVMGEIQYAPTIIESEGEL